MCCSQGGCWSPAWQVSGSVHQPWEATASYTAQLNQTKFHRNTVATCSVAVAAALPNCTAASSRLHCSDMQRTQPCCSTDRASKNQASCGCTGLSAPSSCCMQHLADTVRAVHIHRQAMARAVPCQSNGAFGGLVVSQTDRLTAAAQHQS